MFPLGIFVFDGPFFQASRVPCERLVMTLAGPGYRKLYCPIDVSFIPMVGLLMFLYAEVGTKNDIDLNGVF